MAKMKIIASEPEYHLILSKREREFLYDLLGSLSVSDIGDFLQQKSEKMLNEFIDLQDTLYSALQQGEV